MEIAEIVGKLMKGLWDLMLMCDEYKVKNSEIKELHKFIKDLQQCTPALVKRFKEIEAFGTNRLENMMLGTLATDITEATDKLTKWSSDQSFLHILRAPDRQRELKNMRIKVMSSIQKTFFSDVHVSQATKRVILKKTKRKATEPFSLSMDQKSRFEKRKESDVRNLRSSFELDKSYLIPLEFPLTYEKRKPTLKEEELHFDTLQIQGDLANMGSQVQGFSIPDLLRNLDVDPTKLKPSYIHDTYDERDDIIYYSAHEQDDVISMDFLNFLKDMDLLREDEPFNVAKDPLQNDCALRNLLKIILEENTFIKDIGIEEVFQTIGDQTAIVFGFFNAITDYLEFYFENGERMAKIVGVGMQHAKASFKPGLVIEVQEIEKEEWENKWSGIKSGLDTTGKIVKVTLPTRRAQVFERKSSSFLSKQHEDTRAQVFKKRSTFFKSRRHEDTSDFATSSSFEESVSIASNNAFQVPFLWELSKYFILKRVIDELPSKGNFGTSSGSSKINSIDDCPKDTSGRGKTSGEEGWQQAAKEGAGEEVKRFFLRKMRGKINQEDDGGCGDGNDDNYQQGKSPIGLKDEICTTKVELRLLSGGRFYMQKKPREKPEEKPREKPEEKPTEKPKEKQGENKLTARRVENVKIRPNLTFDFRKTLTASKEILKEIHITVGEVSFGLHPDCDLFESCGRFGLFHDELWVGFGPSKEDHTRVHLKNDFKAEGYEPGKTIFKASSSKETTTNFQKGFQVKGVLGNNAIGRGEVGGALRWGTSESDQQSSESSLESPRIQTSGGFHIYEKHILHEAWLVYQYKAPHKDIVAEDLLDPSYRYRLSNSPICSFQMTKFSGTWVPESEEDLAPYVFRAQRNLREIKKIEEELECSSSTSVSNFFQSMNLMKKSEDRGKKKVKVRTIVLEQPPIKQKYEKKVYINHAMTHLVDKDYFILSEGCNSRQPLWRRNVPLASL